MSKTVKRKITVELPKPRDLSKNRLSVFQRLGTKKHKTADPLQSEAISESSHQQYQGESAVKITEKSNTVALEDADPDLLEKKRAELQKELELQLKMEGTRPKVSKEQQLVRKRKRVQSSTSSSSSSSNSSSSESSSSCSSRESKRKLKKIKMKRQNSSTSSDEPRIKKVKIKKVCHKKIDPNKPHKMHTKKAQMVQGVKYNKRSHSPSASTRKRLPSDSRSTHKMHLKLKPTSELVSPSVPSKHHRGKELPIRMEKDRIDALQHPRDRDRERERIRSRDREQQQQQQQQQQRGRSRTPPKMRTKSRTPNMSRPTRDMIHKSSPRRMGTPTKSRLSGGGGSLGRRERTPPERSSLASLKKRHPNERDRERDRREKERQDREAAREKERAEILARCQERQRERERLAREKLRREREREDERKSDRLLPRPAERAMAIAAARDRNRDKSIERDRRHRSHSHGRIGGGRDTLDREKELLAYDRQYERDDPRYDADHHHQHHHHHHHMDRMYEKDERSLIEERERYMVIRSSRRDDSRGHSPYGMRDKRLMERDEMGRELYMSGSGGGGDQRYDDHLRDERDREPLDPYPPSRGYVDDRHRIVEREREWLRENELVHEQERRMVYDHPQDRHSVREWDRSDGMGPGHSSVPSHQDSYVDSRDWNSMDHQWDGGSGGGGVGSGGGGNWPQEPEEPENWDSVEDKEWHDYHRMHDKLRHDNIGPMGPQSAGAALTNVGVGAGGGGGGGGVSGPGGNRRWSNWRNRRGNIHHGPGGGGGGNNGPSDYRRHMHNDGGTVFPSRADLSINRRLHPKPEPYQSSTASTSNTVTDAPRGPSATRNQCNMQITSEPEKSTEINQPELKPSSITASVVSTPVASAPVQAAITTTTAPAITTTNNETDESTVDVKKNDAGDDTEEVIPDDLSEISGDDADDILNRQEELQDKQTEESIETIESTITTPKESRDMDITVETSAIQSATIDTASNETAATTAAVAAAATTTTTLGITKTDSQESTVTTKDLPDEMDLDFEEISDGELEEEARIRGLGDALGVDWASLVEESKAIAKEKSLIISNTTTTCKQKWQPHRILLDVGISMKMGGKEFATKILTDSYDKLKVEQMNVPKIVKTKLVDDYDEYDEIYYDPDDRPTPTFIHDIEDVEFHDMAFVQVAARKNQEKMDNLVFNATGPYSRALSYQRDIQMRRQLNGLSPIDINEDYNQNYNYMYKGCGNNNDGYKNIARELLLKAIAKVN